MKILLADNQDITRAGLMYLLGQMEGVSFKHVEDKAELIEELKAAPDSGVVLDYTLFDLNDVEELLILGQRFHESSWLLFSEDLSVDFSRRVMVSSSQFGILLKDSPLSEISEALSYILHHRRFVGQHVAEMLFAHEPAHEEKVRLTPTETEILRDIALGFTTKEIADRRFSSFHTVNTHRKNIFRKLGVNNAREVTKYALRSGLIDSAEYYI